MSEKPLPPGWIDGQKFIENRNRFPGEEYLKYGGQYIAWSLDGTRILASGKTAEELDENLRALGISPSDTLDEYVDPPEITCRL